MGAALSPILHVLLTLWLSSHCEVGSLLPLPELGWACDHGSDVIWPKARSSKVIQFQSDALWGCPSWNQPPCCKEAQTSPCRETTWRGRIQSFQLTAQPSPGWQPSTSRHEWRYLQMITTPLVFSAEATDIIKQRQAISTVSCLNFWPTEPENKINKSKTSRFWSNLFCSSSNWYTWWLNNCQGRLPRGCDSELRCNGL